MTALQVVFVIVVIVVVISVLVDDWSHQAGQAAAPVGAQDQAIQQYLLQQASDVQRSAARSKGALRSLLTRAFGHVVDEVLNRIFAWLRGQFVGE